MALKIAKIMAQNRFTLGVKMGIYHGALIKALRYISYLRRIKELIRIIQFVSRTTL